MDSLTTLAEEYEKNNDWQKALEIYRKLDINKIQTLEKIAWCNSRLGNYEEAITYFLKCIEIDRTARYLYMIGYQYYCLKNWSKAIEYYEEAIKIYPNYLVVRYRLAYSYYQLAGKYKQFTKPEFWRCIGNLEECHKIWELYDNKNKAKNKSTYGDICFLHGKILISLDGKAKQAISLLKQACSIKKDENYQYELAKAYYKNKDIQKAKELIPKSNKYYIEELKIYILIAENKYDEALYEVKKLSKKRNKEYIKIIEAYIHINLKNYKQAYNLLNRIIEQNSKNHKAHYYLALLYKENQLLIHAKKEAEIANNIKINNYGSIYSEATSLMNEINLQVDDNYIEDDRKLRKLQQRETKATGEIVKYNNSRGYGFISYRGKNIFFNINDCLFKDVSVEMKVEFDIVHNKKGTQAININKVH